MSRFENLKRNQGMEVDMNEETSSYDIPDIFKRRKNDLEVYVEPLKTSRSLCLTIIGEILTLLSGFLMGLVLPKIYLLYHD